MVGVVVDLAQGDEVRAGDGGVEGALVHELARPDVPDLPDQRVIDVLGADPAAVRPRDGHVHEARVEARRAAGGKREQRGEGEGTGVHATGP